MINKFKLVQMNVNIELLLGDEVTRKDALKPTFKRNQSKSLFRTADRVEFGEGIFLTPQNWPHLQVSVSFGHLKIVLIIISGSKFQ